MNLNKLSIHHLPKLTQNQQPVSFLFRSKQDLNKQLDTHHILALF